MNTETKNQNRSEAALAWAQALEKNHKIDANALNETLLAFQLNQLLESFNFDGLKTKLENAKDYRDIVSVILEQSNERTKRLKVELELQMYKENVTAQKQKIGDALDKSEFKKGFSPETLRDIEAAMARM